MWAFLDTLSDIDVIGEAADGQAALDELAVLDNADNLPDVLLMPRLDGVPPSSPSAGVRRAAVGLDSYGSRRPPGCKFPRVR
jgi:hypothetical protein